MQLPRIYSIIDLPAMQNVSSLEIRDLWICFKKQIGSWTEISNYMNKTLILLIALFLDAPCLPTCIFVVASS